MEFANHGSSGQISIVRQELAVVNLGLLLELDRLGFDLFIDIFELIMSFRHGAVLVGVGRHGGKVA